jgi:anion-transporting  ArsA/GET3 family ATPase
MTDLLGKRLVFVTGKGGVGKSTVAAALGIAGARRGLRTIVAEVSGRGDVARMLGAPDGGDSGERLVRPGLWSIAIDPQRSMEEYLVDQLPVRALADLLAGSRTFGYLTAATPGMRELLTVGKIWELAQPERRVAGGEPYDLVVVDAPATGHGIAFLAAPRTFAKVAQVGPVARQGNIIDGTLHDPALTAVVGVSTPQEPAVNETVELLNGLRAQLGLELDRLIVNALHPWRFTPRDVAALHAALERDPSPTTRHAVEVALAEEELVLGERAQLRRLRQSVAGDPIELPFLFSARMAKTELEMLCDVLEAAL